MHCLQPSLGAGSPQDPRRSPLIPQARLPKAGEFGLRAFGGAGTPLLGIPLRWSKGPAGAPSSLPFFPLLPPGPGADEEESEVPVTGPAQGWGLALPGRVRGLQTLDAGREEFKKESSEREAGFIQEEAG